MSYDNPAQPERKPEAHVKGDKYTREYTGKGGHPYVKFHHTEEYRRRRKQDAYRGGHYKRQATKNPFEGLGYYGDRIGKIHIASMIPHLKRKRK